jgi:HEAT repeat protein
MAAFRSEEASERIARGAANANNPLARQMYIQAMGTPERASRAHVLIELLKAGESRVRAAAVRSLRPLPPRRAVLDAVAPLLKDRCWSVRTGAAEVVARMPADLAIPLLVEAVGRETGEPALVIDSLLRSLTGSTFERSGPGWQAWLRRNADLLRDGRFEPVEAPPKPEGDTAAAFFEIPVESRNLVLVMDLSSSMRAELTKIDARTRELLRQHGYGDSRLAAALVNSYRLIGGLPKDARLNVLAFSDGVSRFTSKATQVTESSKKNAIKWLNEQRMGYCTNIWDALRQAFGDHMGSGGSTRFDDLPDTVIFVTDGTPTAGRFRDADALLQLVGIWNASAGASIHCVGIGTTFADDLMRKLAESTGGLFLDTRFAKLEGRRIRPTVPEEERCPPVAKLLEGLEDEIRNGGTYARREAATRAADACSWTDAGPSLLAVALADAEGEVREAAAASLASLGERGVPELVKAASLADGPARLEAIRALGTAGPAAAAAAPALEAIASGPDAALAAEAGRALAAIRAKRK